LVAGTPLYTHKLTSSQLCLLRSSFLQTQVHLAYFFLITFSDKLLLRWQGLTPSLFWSNREFLLGPGEAGIESRIRSLVSSAAPCESASPAALPCVSAAATGGTATQIGSTNIFLSDASGIPTPRAEAHVVESDIPKPLQTQLLSERTRYNQHPYQQPQIATELLRTHCCIVVFLNASCSARALRPQLRGHRLLGDQAGVQLLRAVPLHSHKRKISFFFFPHLVGFAAVHRESLQRVKSDLAKVSVHLPRVLAFAVEALKSKIPLLILCCGGTHCVRSFSGYISPCE
jgi:hypothetical protein